MDRWITVSQAKENLVPGEFLVTNVDGIRIDEGSKKTQYVNGELSLTSHRLLWTNPAIIGQSSLTLPLQRIIYVEDEPRSFMQSEKVTLHLEDLKNEGNNIIKLAFKQSGKQGLMEKLFEALRQKRWEIKVIRPKIPQQRAMRSGIGGIEKSMQKKMKQRDSDISKAFKDLDKLMEMAKPMVALAKSMSTKIREKGGGLAAADDDETTQFKSYLMSLGISDPVTRESHGSGQTYFKNLAKEIIRILEKPLEESGGMMTLTDAFCRVNRARGMELLSPEDLLNACKTLERGNHPIRLHTFEKTGVSVLQLATAQVDSEKILQQTDQIVGEHLKEGITAEEFARTSGVAVVLAKERLLAAENLGRVCRDDSVEGLRFFPNLILTS